eukprot:6012856-Pyramimonas_sp.AAC.1
MAQHGLPGEDLLLRAHGQVGQFVSVRRRQPPSGIFESPETFSGFIGKLGKQRVRELVRNVQHGAGQMVQELGAGVQEPQRKSRLERDGDNSPVAPLVLG